MPNFKAWISAARLRTLPLSVSGIIVGSSLAMNHLFWQSSIFWLAILTTIGFQVLSNFANDYGDGIKGADDNREGEQRMVSSGLISPKQMKTGILITAIFSMISAIVLIYYAFGAEDFLHSLLFFMLGIASVIAALKYTIGENAYGYSGLGDVLAPKFTTFSGSFQELRYYAKPITKDNFDSYVMNPYSIESSENLAFRASLGGELFTGSTSIHPKVSGSWVTTSSFASNSNFSILGNYAWAPNTEIFYFDQVTAGIQNAISDKIKQQSIILPYSSSNSNIPNANVLSPYRSIQQFPAISSSYTRDIDYVEVGFSPQNEINEDINSQLGYINLGDVIGDPRFQSSSLETYPALDAIKESYFQKYTKNYQEFDYIRLIEFFDNSLFKTIQDFTPARTSLAAGIIIKNTLLDRNRYPVPQVSPSASIAFIGSGSTNSNIPFSRNIPAVTIGRGGSGKHGHSLNEWWLNEDGNLAIKNALLILVSQAGGLKD